MDLSLAIQNNDYSRLEKLLKNGADANAKDENGVSLLHQAVNYKREKIVKLLLKNDADVLKVTRDKGNTALHIAVVKSSFAIVAALLNNVSRDKVRKLLDVKTKKSGSTALHVAAKSYSYEIAKLLLIKGATYDLRDKEGKKPMDFANGQLLESLLRTIEINFTLMGLRAIEVCMNLEEQPLEEYLCMTNCRDSQGRTLLQVALRQNYMDFVKILLTVRHEISSGFSRTDVEALNELASSFEIYVKKSQERLTKLSKNVSKPAITLREGNILLDEVRKLLRAFYVYEQKICKPIRVLNIHSIEEILEFLERDINYRKLLQFASGVGAFVRVNVLAFIPAVALIKRAIFTAKLHVASKSNDLIEVERCLASHLDVNERDGDSKRSPLHFAAFYGYVDLTRMLLDWRASLTCLDGSGNMPLHIAASNGHLKIVETLLARNLEMINVESTSSGFTALHLAASDGYLHVVKCLLKHGARYSTKSRNGKMPIDMAKGKELFGFFLTINVLFAMATQGDEKVMNELKKLKNDELMAVTNARDDDNYTLAQSAIVNGYKTIADGIKRVVKLAAGKRGGNN